jgi:hypothetical protein
VRLERGGAFLEVSLFIEREREIDDFFDAITA